VKPRLLFLTPYFPDPAQNGSPRRVHAVLQALAAHHDITVLQILPPWLSRAASTPPAGAAGFCFLPPRAGTGLWLRLRRRLAGNYPRLFYRLTGEPLDWNHPTRARRRLAAELLADQPPFAVIHAYRLSMAPFALELKRRLGGNPSLHLDLDDVESLARARLAELHRSNGRARECVNEHINARAYARNEHCLLPRFDRVYVCSETDAARLRPGHTDVRVLPNTVPVPALAPAPPAPAERIRFLFIGAFGHFPNEDAVRWFCLEILPALSRARRCELAVAGLQASPAFQQFLAGRADVVFLGAVADSTSVYKAAHVVVVPLRSGGGTRIKILEAFAQGRPVVTTTIGIEGIDAHPGEDHLRADTPAAFITQCLRLADDPSLRVALAARARALVSTRYTSGALESPLAPGAFQEPAAHARLLRRESGPHAL
jgi:polysaccharide biosynthesis protein PslH